MLRKEKRRTVEVSHIFMVKQERWKMVDYFPAFLLQKTYRVRFSLAGIMVGARLLLLPKV
jgi:hypothetical protein